MRYTVSQSERRERANFHHVSVSEGGRERSDVQAIVTCRLLQVYLSMSHRMVKVKARD